MPPPHLAPRDFVATWRATQLSERASYQQHFLDLCHLIGHATPAELDPTGRSFTFEAGVAKQGGGQGWADVWKRGAFAWEYKGKHANLDKAYQQLLQYREALQNPPLLIVSDIDTIVIHTNFTNTVKQVYTITLDDVLTTAGLTRLRDVFENPDAFRAAQTTEQVTREAATQFASLAARLRRWEGDDPAAAQRIAHFLIRLLFCLFAEDVGLLPNKLFSRLIESTRRRPALFAAQLGQLFTAMAEGGFFSMEDVPHFNGTLFDDASVIEMSSDELDLLAKASTLDWSSIEPAILGTLFERSLDPAKRSQLGAHYTSREDILLIVEPVLMLPLRRRWAAVQAQANDLAARRDAASVPAQRTRQQSELAALLQGFAQEIAGVRVLDAACGSGNFLYVALKQLLDLEKEVITFAGDIGVGRFFPNVGPEQLRGIEINEYAHELAQITVWIGYIQWLRDNGFGSPAQPILKTLDTIQHMDALLAFDADGKPYEPAWPDADVIVGNPPFLGGSKIRREFGDQYAENLWHLFRDRLPSTSDFVCYWFQRAHDLIVEGKVQRVGLLATNSIRQPHNRTVLNHIDQNSSIFMAWSDRPWVLEGAAVRVSIVGFDSGQETHKTLDGLPVIAINPDLTGAINLTVARRLKENINVAFVGSEKGGHFEVEPELANQMLRAPININSKPNSDVLKPWINGLDITRRPRGMWIIDFGVGKDESEVALYEQPFEYIRRTVYPERSQNRRIIHAQRWWQHREASLGMRNAIPGLRRYIVTPRVAKYRTFVWVAPPTLPDNNLAVFARQDDYFFGVLHSKLHELWSLRMGTSLEDRPRYTPTTCFETFPFPFPPGQEPQGDPRIAAIGAAAARLVELRDNWLNPTDADEAELKKRTLTSLYNARPAWLAMVHAKLDQTVLAAYGWPADLSDVDMLEHLLALNLTRAAGDGAGGGGGMTPPGPR